LAQWLKITAVKSAKTRVGIISELLPLFAIVLISFACGYGLREWIARRRRAAAREKFYQENPDLRLLKGL
jgi:hypothetical protein